MRYYIRYMREEDIPPVTEIDREAFPTTLPPPNYRRELQSPLARYVVACGEAAVSHEEAAPEPERTGLFSRVRQLFSLSLSSDRELPAAGGQDIVGFAGIWLMAGEAHMINLAVREHCRRRGVGELLLIAIIDLAAELGAKFITLEVRASNVAARCLYAKYGFIQVGLRHGYYVDNREDGVLMSTGSIASSLFQARSQRLKEAHSRRWGIALYQICR